MKTRTKIISVLLGAMTIASIQSCKKYPEGPGLSFHSKTERVSNTWKVDNYKVNGSDYTSLVVGYVETFSKDGNYSFSFGSIAGTGKWEFQNNDMEILITGTSNQSSETLFIQKLEEKQFWNYYMDGNDKKEFHLIEN